MNSAAYVAELIEKGIAEGRDPQAIAWDAALACAGWAYVFGAYGDWCDPSNRRSRYRESHPTIKSKCKNFNGRDTVPAGCVGCQWFLGTAESDESRHEGRTRFFDCRGYVYWILHNVFGMWERCPAGATTMWNTAKNWKAKGKVADGVPEDVLVCLFVHDKEDKKKMSHIGFGFHGETLECSSGVQHFTKRNKKWTHWAVPVCIGGEVPEPEPKPEPKPEHRTLRLGAKGPEVREMQEKLLRAGEKLPRYGADGDFGRETLAAVRAFQRSHPPLAVDGICGPKTWAELDKVTGVRSQVSGETDKGGEKG